MKADKLNDFNEVIKYYEEILKFAKYLSPNVNMMPLIQEFMASSIGRLSEIQYYRVICNNVSLLISQLHERSLSISDDALEASTFDNIESIDNLVGKEKELSLIEKKKQLRNCLAHAEYSISFENPEKIDIPVEGGYAISVGEINVDVENKYVKGKIPFYDIMEFAQRYISAYGFMKGEQSIPIIINPNHRKAKTPKQYIDNLRKIRIFPKETDEGVPYNTFVYRFIKENKISDLEERIWRTYFDEIRRKTSCKSFELKEEELPENRKEFFKKYIDYVGLDTMKNSMFASMALSEVLAPNAENIVSVENLTGIPETILELIRQKQVTYIKLHEAIERGNLSIIAGPQYMAQMQRIADALKKYQYQAPMIYANNLLGMAYYCFDYSREVNEHEGKMLFNFFDMKNLDGIKAKLINPDGSEAEVEIEEEINPKQKAKNKLQDATSQLNNLRKKKKKQEDLKKQLEHPKNKDPKKEEKLEDVNKWLEEYDENEAAMILRKTELEEEEKSSPDIVCKDSTEFFRHFRNSLAHGNYTVTYGDFKKLDSITYSFSDHDESTNSIYKIEISAVCLEKLIKGFQEKINESDKGYLDAKKTEKGLLEKALKFCHIDKDDVEAEKKKEKSIWNIFRRKKKVKEGKDENDL